MSARTHPIQTHAERMATRHAKTFTAEQAPYCEHVHRLSLDGYNAHQIASLTRKPMIDVRLILAGIERQSEREWLEECKRRARAEAEPQTEVTTRVKRRRRA